MQKQTKLMFFNFKKDCNSGSLFFVNLYSILFILIAFAQNSNAQGIRVLSGSYIQEKYQSDSLIERIGGQFVYDFVSVKVINEKPYYQITQVLGNQMQIYYPEKAMAFEYSGKKPFDYPIISNLIPLMNDNYGLEELGFSIDSVYIKKDTTISWWKTPISENKGDFYFELKSVQDRLYSMSMVNKNSSLNTVSIFSEYGKVDSYFLPKLIVTKKWISGKSETEKLYFDSFSLSKSEGAITPILFSDTINVKSYQY